MHYTAQRCKIQIERDEREGLMRRSATVRYELGSPFPSLGKSTVYGYPITRQLMSRKRYEWRGYLVWCRNRGRTGPRLNDSWRSAFVPLPFTKVIVDVHHTRPVEYMRSGFDLLPIHDLAVLPALQLRTPDAPVAGLRVMRGNRAAALLASIAGFPRLLGDVV